MEFAALVPLGPAEIEIERARDLYDSLVAYEPEATIWLVLVDDCLRSRRLRERFPNEGNCRVVEMLNPRRGMGSGWSGGLSAGVTEGLRWIDRFTRASFVVRLDTDSLVIGPFSETVASAFRRMPRVGLLGSHTRIPGKIRQEPRLRSHARLERKLLKPFALWVRRYPWRGIQISCWGRWRAMREAIRQAMANGYELGDFVMGGGYALRRETLEQFDAMGFLEDPLMWIDTPISEDVVVSVYTKAAGFDFADFNCDDEPFGVKHEGLVDTPENLVRRGFSIIHAVKNDKRFSEEEVREFFRVRRCRSQAASTSSGSTVPV